MYRYPNFAIHNVIGKREERKRIGSPKLAEREAKRAQISIQILVSLANGNPPGGVLKNRIYN